MKRGFLLTDSSSTGSGGWGRSTKGWGSQETSKGWGSQNSASPKEMGPLRDSRSNPPTWDSAPPAPRENKAFTKELPPLKGLSFMPTKTSGTPKVPLGKWYMQKPRSIELSKEQYQTWHDNGKPHERRYTSIFVCPLTGEVWPSGRFGSDPKIFTVKRDESTGVDVVWYTTKKLAEHGAAARAHDCLSMREVAGTKKLPTRLGQDEPYMSTEEAPPLPPLPPDIEVKVQDLRKSAVERMQVEPEPAPEVEIEEEAQRYREQYRAERTGRKENETKVKRQDGMEM